MRKGSKDFTPENCNIMSRKESDSKLEIGDDAPEFELEDYKGEHVALSDLENFDGVLVVFMCNHCPYVQTQVNEIKQLAEDFPSLAIVGVNANVETHPMDSFEKMSDFIEGKELALPNFYYLADSEQEVAESYGAKCTPDPFLLDYRHKLFYHGKLNDKEGSEDEPEERYMKEAVQKMLKRKEPPTEQPPSVGCSIKWKDTVSN
ncbi:MAG: peroxiredoxin [Candidatus Nanohaloarchaea archaeon]|jgi:peroxiredoxin